jgi:hypothetical protein
MDLARYAKFPIPACYPGRVDSSHYCIGLIQHLGCKVEPMRCPAHARQWAARR